MANVSRPPGLEVVLGFDGADASLVRLASRATDGDYVAFARRAVLNAARAISSLVPPDWQRAARRDASTTARSGQYEAAVALGLTISEAAAEYGVKHDRLQRAARDGRLRARKVGEGRRYPWLVEPIDVERFLATTKRGPKRRTAA
jgi:excisionase family DNA binding protein